MIYVLMIIWYLIGVFALFWAFRIQRQHKVNFFENAKIEVFIALTVGGVFGFVSMVYLFFMAIALDHLD